jgi:hypothetical protein
MEQAQQVMERFGEVEEIQGLGRFNKSCALVTFKSRAAEILKSQCSSLICISVPQGTDLLEFLLGGASRY